MNEDDVTEAIWTLQVATGQMYPNSYNDISVAFNIIFPENIIAQTFSTGQIKASYVIIHALIPYFQEMSHKAIKQCCDKLVCFDKPLNKVIQRDGDLGC